MKKLLMLLALAGGLSFYAQADDACCTPPVPPCPAIECSKCVNPCYIAGFIVPGSNQVGTTFVATPIGSDANFVYTSIQFNRPYCNDTVTVAWGSGVTLVKASTKSHAVIASVPGTYFYFLTMPAT